MKEAEEILAEIFDDSEKEDQNNKNPQEFGDYDELDEHDSEDDNSKGCPAICRFEPKRCHSLGEKPAIKILLANHISLKQFQAIKVLTALEKHFLWKTLRINWTKNQQSPQKPKLSKNPSFTSTTKVSQIAGA